MSDIKVGRGFICFGNLHGHPIVLNVDCIKDVYMEEVESTWEESTPKGKTIQKTGKRLRSIIRMNDGQKWWHSPESYPPEKIFEAITRAKLSPTEQLDARL